METLGWNAFFQNKNLIPVDFNTCTEGLFDLSALGRYSEYAILEMREQFIRKGYVRLDGFLSNASLMLIQAELERLRCVTKAKDFEMPGYETPRKLNVLGGSDIKTLSPLLYKIYHHHAIKNCIEKILGRSIYFCNHPEEYMVANFLTDKGDTHGWHLDDPAYALVLFLEAPGRDAGGELEVISNWDDLCQKKGFLTDQNIQVLLEWAKENNFVEQHFHRAKDAYLLRADRNLHRVTPLSVNGAKRTVVNMAYQSSPETPYKNTADMLYGY